MTDTSAYVNAYIDTTISMLHENLSTLLQLKTQAKLSNELIKAKNDEIVKLQEELEKVKTDLDTNKSDLQSKLDSTRSELEKTITTDNEQINNARADAKKWEDQFNAIKNKVSHIDALSNQLNEMKQNLIAKNNEVEELKKKLEEKNQEIENIKQKQSIKKIINTKGKTKPIEPTIEENDDF